MRSARCLILSHQVHLQSQIHCWIGRSHHHQTTPLEKGRVPNMYVYLTADGGTTIIAQIHVLYTLHRRSMLAEISKPSTWKTEVTSSPSYLSARQFANWNSLRYQSVNQSILLSNVPFVKYFLKHFSFISVSLHSLPLQSLHISCIRKLSPSCLRVLAKDPNHTYSSRQRCAVGPNKFGYLKSFCQHPRPFPKWDPICGAAATTVRGHVAHLSLNWSLDVRTSHAAFQVTSAVSVLRLFPLLSSSSRFIINLRVEWLLATR